MTRLICVAWIALAGFIPVLAVAAINPNFEVKGGLVYARDSNLTWQRCSVGQEWKEGAGCTGKIRILTFKEALGLAKGGWRVPDKDELAGLIDHQRRDFPTIDADAFPDMIEGDPTYWTSTPNNDDRSWDVRFMDGYVTDDVNSRHYAVRLVKSGK